MKFSIVTPSFNQARYLPDCLRSVSRQTHQDTEHLIIDGGSTDATVPLLEEFLKHDYRLRYVSEPDRGQADAVNKGFARASGEIVAWINSDDFYFSPEVFSIVNDIFAHHPNTDVVYGGMGWVDLNGRLVHVRIPPPHNWSRLAHVAYIGNTNTFFRRRVIEKYQVDLRFHYVLDHEFLLRVTRDFETYRTKQVLACFRVQPDAKTQKMTEASKNFERRVRDKELGITRSRAGQVRQVWERIWFRLALWRTDRTYLERWNADSPYRSFLAVESAL